MDAREIIADAACRPDWNKLDTAHYLICRLAAHGYQIIPRDENHGPTLERAANEITSFIAKRDAMLALEYHVNAAHGGDATVDEFAPFMADYFAAAIRAMGEKK